MRPVCDCPHRCDRTRHDRSHRILGCLLCYILLPARNRKSGIRLRRLYVSSCSKHSRRRSAQPFCHAAPASAMLICALTRLGRSGCSCGRTSDSPVGVMGFPWVSLVTIGNDTLGPMDAGLLGAAGVVVELGGIVHRTEQSFGSLGHGSLP